MSDTSPAVTYGTYLKIDELLQLQQFQSDQFRQLEFGTKKGTGGSAGAPYLQATVGRPAFPDLWEIRSSL